MLLHKCIHDNYAIFNIEDLPYQIQTEEEINMVLSTTVEFLIAKVQVKECREDFYRNYPEVFWG